MITRRSALQLLGAAAASSCLSHATYAAPRRTGSYPIGACDWSIGHRQHIDAFDAATKIGLSGLQVSFSTPDSEYDLRDKNVREQYYRRIDETGVQIASLAMGVLNKLPLATHPEAIDWVSDAIDAMAAMEKEQPGKATNVCLLAFFGKGDINGQPELMDAVIQKLKTVAGKAEDHGVVFGIESLLSADDHLKIIDGVGSDAIQVYYDTANSNRMGYDIYREVVQLGGDRICEVHCKENGELLGNGVIDFPKFKKSLQQIDYTDWLIIEGATPKQTDIVDAYRQNYAFLDSLFHGER